MSKLKSFLVPPTNAGDGNTRLETADVLRQEIESPINAAHAGARRDAIIYLVHNATSSNDAVNVRKAVNVRWNLPWTVVDEIISEAQPLAEQQIKRIKAERDISEKRQTEFESLSVLFTTRGLQVQQIENEYTLTGLTELQVRRIADILAADEGNQ